MCGCFLISDHCDVWLHSDLASAPSRPANARTARLPHPHDHPKGHPHMHPHCHPNALQWSLGCPKTIFLEFVNFFGPELHIVKSRRKEFKSKDT